MSGQHEVSAVCYTFSIQVVICFEASCCCYCLQGRPSMLVARTHTVSMHSLTAVVFTLRHVSTFARLCLRQYTAVLVGAALFADNHKALGAVVLPSLAPMTTVGSPSLAFRDFVVLLHQKLLHLLAGSTAMP